MSNDHESKAHEILRNRPFSVRGIACSVRVAQLLGLAGSVHGVIHCLTSASTVPAWPILVFWGACVLLLITSTLMLQWFKRQYPHTAARAVQAADKKWNTPLEEKRAKLWLGCILAVAGAIARG